MVQPFSSIQDVLQTYNMFGIVPLIKPIAVIPGAVRKSLSITTFLPISNHKHIEIVKMAVVHRFDTLKAVPVSTPLNGWQNYLSLQ